MITKEYLQQELAKRIDGYKRGVETTTDNIIAEMKSILVLVDALPDYEKKYKEALERAKNYHDNNFSFGTTKLTEAIFPELREKPLTPFQQCLNCILRGVYYAEVPDKKVNEFIVNVVRTRTDELIKLAKKQEHTDCQLNKSKDEAIRQQLLWLCDEWEHNPERRTIPADIGNIKQIRKYLEKQKESLHVQETYKENADSFTSEDERIRKEIVDFLETIPASELKRIPRPISEWFAWLEKQKESHIPWYDYQKSKEAGYTIVPNEEYEQLIKQKEQKPQVFCEAKAYDLGYKQGKEDAIKEQKPAEWSKEDKDYYDTIVCKLEVIGDDSGLSSNQIKFLREHCPSHCSKWDEEDKTIIEGACNALEIYGHTKLASMLKSLRPSWKPSEEQMKALEIAFRKDGDDKYRSTINSLYNDLKKL